MALEPIDEPPELFDFVEQYLEDLEQGGPRPLQHYLERFPEHVEAVTREYRQRTQSARRSGERPGGDGPVAPEPGAGGPRAPIRVGPYRLIRQLARGGQGTVYLAEDTRIARRVALKILTTLFSHVPEHRLRRFRREAEVVSKLDHPGICGVFDADLEGEVPYLAMRYVEGETLADLLARARPVDGTGDRSPFAPPSRGRGPICRPATEAELHRTLEYFVETARALQAAHEAGVVHRDIKPGNLMVSTEGRPVVLDFGLAHDDAADSALTQAGELFGTPAYMAPEQIAGRAAADPRTDVYALGVVLYECLALERPFEAPTREALYHAVATGALVPVRTHNPELPREVEVVLEKALERDPARRYASASELGEDLRRLARGEPIRARAAGPWLRLRRWTRRHPLIASTTIGALLFLGTGLVLSTSALRKINATNRLLTASVLGSKALMMKDENPTVSLLLGIESASTGGGFTGNMALLAALATCRERRTLEGHTDQVLDAELIPSRGWLATASADGTALVFELESGRIVARLEGHASTVTAVAAAPDPVDPGRTLVATGGTDGAVLLHRLEPDGVAEPPLRLAAASDDAGEPVWTRALAFDARGERLAATWNDGAVRLFESGGGEPLRSLAGHAGVATQVEFSPDGSLLLTASGDPALHTRASSDASDHTARVFDTLSGATRTVLELPDLVVDAHFSPDGRRIATACEDGAVRIHSLDGEPVAEFALEQRARACAWSPDGRHLIGIHAGAVQIWSAPEERLLRLRGTGELGVSCAAFSPDSQRVVTGGLDNTARVWDVRSGDLLATLTRTKSPITECFWTPDGSRIVTATRGRMAHVWYADDPPGITVLEGHHGPISTVEFDPSSERVLSSSLDGTARIWHRAEGRLLVELGGHAGRVRSAAFGPAGERVVTASDDGTARLWDAATGGTLAVLEGHGGGVQWAGFSPTGGWIATLAPRNGVFLWTGAGERAAAIALDGDEVLRVDFSEDGGRLATTSSELAPRIFSVPDGSAVAVLERPGGGRVYDACFVPGTAGRRMATASEDGYVRIWDVDRAAVLTEEPFITPGLVDVDPRGTRLLVANRGGIATVVGSSLTGPRIFLGERPSRGEEGRPMAHDMQITVASFSPDGALCMTASRDGTASLWDAATGSAIERFEEHTKGVFDARFSPDGAWVATGSRNGTVRVWPVDPLEIARSRKPRELTDEERERYGGVGTYAGSY